MQIAYASFRLLFGVVLLVLGASGLVSGAAALARRFRVSEITIGLTVVALGTSAPELAVNLTAAFVSAGELVLGNVIGSNVFNTLAVVGAAALVRPLVIGIRTRRLELPYAAAIALLLPVLIQSGIPMISPAGTLSRPDGAILLGVGAVFGLYVFGPFRAAKAPGEDTAEAGETPGRNLGAASALLLTLLGAAILMGSGRLIVDSAVEIAEALEVATRIIALTVVAIGTSLPELATAVVAAGRGNTDLAVGNVIGSNVINVVFVLGVSAVVAPITAPGAVALELVTHLLAVGAVLACVYLGPGRRISRTEGAALLLGYLVYLALVLRS